MKHIFLYILLLFGINTGLFSQSNYTVEKIGFKDVGKNSEGYLRLFLSTKEGTILDMEVIDQDLEQLNRRPGVAKSTYTIDTLNDQKVNLTFNIEAQRTLIPQFGIGGIKNNFWWQVGAAEFNLGGTGQTLLANYLHNDGRANFKIFYQNDWINGTPWGFGAEVNRTASIEPLYFPQAAVNYRYTNVGAGFFGTRNIGYNKKVLVGVNYFQEDYKKEIVNNEMETPGPDELLQKKVLFKADFAVNRIGYDYFYRSGFQWNILGQSVFTINESMPFSSITFEGKKFWRPFQQGNFALRVRAALASNNDSPFAPFVLDSRVNIRGVGNRVDRGTAQFVLNLEYRHTVFHKNRFAAQVLVFADSGTWRNPGGEFKELFQREQFRQFVGLGIRWIDKKVFRSVFRFDYGFDLWNSAQNGPVIGVGQFF